MTLKFGKFGNFANFIVRNLVVIWEAPKCAGTAMLTKGSRAGVPREHWEKESIHRPAPVRNFSLPKNMGATEERFRW